MGLRRDIRYRDDYLRQAVCGEQFLLFDGAMGTMLQQAGLSETANPPDLLNLTHAPDIEAIQRTYVEAGSDVITTNTFNANPLKLEGKASVVEVYAAAVRIARAAGAHYVAGDIGPTGALLAPLGTLSFEEAYDQFALQAKSAEEAGCDLILIETMADLKEAKAAVLAAVETTALPVFVTMSFEADGRTFLGTTPQIASTTLSALGVQAVGVNCSVGPDEMLETVKHIKREARCAVMAQPNAGLPSVEDGQTVYHLSAERFAASVKQMVQAGATIVGGCCGTNPACIKAVRAVLDELGAPLPQDRTPLTQTLPQDRAPLTQALLHNSAPRDLTVCSAQEMVSFEQGIPAVKIIGERINPTGKKRLKAALKAGEIDYVVAQAVIQSEAGADILDVNVGLPELDEPALLLRCVEELVSCVTTPLQIDSADPVAIERAVRSYAGRPLVNSVNGKCQNLEEILPIVARYGCSVVGLTLDENGIPPTAEGRLAIAERIVAAAEDYGIPRCDIAIDCLTMAVATNQSEAKEILRAIKLVKERLGVRTVLGVSNISFGLPQRSLMNATFMAAAFGAGLDLPIMDPLNARSMDTVQAFRVVCGQDSTARVYIAAYANAADPYLAGAADNTIAAGAGNTAGAGADVGSTAAVSPTSAIPSTNATSACPIPIPDQAAPAADLVCAICSYVLAGRAAPMTQAVETLLETCEALEIVNAIFIPLLDLVGQKYDSGEFLLPQLMSSAEAVKAGFDVIRKHQETEEDPTQVETVGPVLLATVQGDIHDIGKNIVRMLMENYGIEVIDLGRDVSPEAIVAAVKDHDIKLVGLSALMTTTVRAMEKTIELLRREAPGVAVMVGGAVLTPDYARVIGADFYAKDAAESAQLAIRFFKER